MKTRHIALLLLLLGVFFTGTSQAEVLDLVPVQGILADSEGTPVDGLVDVTFTLYSSETGDTSLWTETYTDLDVVDGFFSVYLGTNTFLDFYSMTVNTEIWLGVTVETDEEMDRIMLASVPFAVEALTSNQVGSLTEDDINNNFVSSSAPAASVTSEQMTQWNDAYGWGNHATAGYLTSASLSETDPVYSGAAASGITSTNITNWNSAYGWGDHASEGYLTSYTESDPVYSAAAASGITSTNITNWNSAYGWGDHASEGYLTSYTESDPVFNAWDKDYADLINTPTIPTNISELTNDAGYLTSEVDGSTTNEIELPSQSGNSGRYLTTDGSNAIWATISTGASSLSGLSDVNTSTATSGNILIADGTDFESVGVSGDISLAGNGTVTIANNSVDGTDIALGSDATGDVMYYDGTDWIRLSRGSDGQVLTLSSGVPTWQTVSALSSSLSVTTQNNDYTIQATDDVIVATDHTQHTYTLPSALAAGEGKTLHIYVKYEGQDGNVFLVAGSDTLYEYDGSEVTSSITDFESFGGVFISDGVNSWYQIVK